MVADPTGVEQAVSRALRDNLHNLQRMAEELQQAIADIVSACGSSRPTNALPPMLRAQAVAASLAAALEVLSRFVTAALQPSERTLAEEAVLRMVAIPPPEQAPRPEPPLHPTPVPMAEAQGLAPYVAADVPLETAQETDMIAEGGPVAHVESATVFAEPEVAASPSSHSEPLAEVAEPPAALPKTLFVQPPSEAAEPAAPSPVMHYVEAPAEAPQEPSAPEPVLEGRPAFDLAALPREAQELHRRASRVAKVSMQDIKMLRPEQVWLGRQHKDICVRLKDDIAKARKEYDRRFQTILDHPVDYFYSWMVEILADGDPGALGEYPYPSAALRR